MTELYIAAVAAHQALAAFDAETDRLTAAVAQHETQSRQLQDRRATLAAREPRMQAKTNRAAVAALLADASSPIAIDDNTVAEEGQAARAHQYEWDRWNAEMRVVDAAIGQIAGFLDRTNGQLAGRTDARYPLWAAFVISAHPYLLGELERAFDTMRDSILLPLLALEIEQVPGVDHRRNRIIGYSRWRVDPASIVRIIKGDRDKPQVLLAGHDYPFDAHNTDGAIAAFRAALGASAS